MSSLIISASLLSVEEVAAWAEHAQHMPSDVVARFIENKITGYDFPELLANEGSLLESELGITRATTKTRIMRGMRMKLLGMGRPPDGVRDGTVAILPCRRVRVSWRDESINSDFPVHKYVVHRYDSSNSGWKLVYDGMETSAVDADAAAATSYTYRISSWNAIGHSEFIFLPITTPPPATWSSDCSPIDLAAAAAMSAYSIASSHSEQASRQRSVLYASFLNIYNAVAGAITAAKYILYVLMFITSLYTSLGRMLRFRAEIKLRFPVAGAIFENIASILAFWFPVDGVTVTFIANLQDKIGKYVIQLSDTFQKLVNDIVAAKKETESAVSSSTSVPMRVMGRRPAPPSALSTREASVRSLLSSSGTSANNDEHDCSGACYSADEDDYGSCSICNKKFKFKLSRWRKRHHCCQCSNVFCGECGVITHANFLQCKVPGSCRCNHCAGVPLQAHLPSIPSNRRGVSDSSITVSSNNRNSPETANDPIDTASASTRPDMKRQRSVSSLWTSMRGGKRRHSATENKSSH